MEFAQEQEFNKKMKEACDGIECLKKDIADLKKSEPCPECHSNVPFNSKYCPNCSVELDWTDTSK